MGDGLMKQPLQKQVPEFGLKNIKFLPAVPMQSVPGAYLRAASALLISLKRDPLFLITIPGKTQAYMASGNNK